MTSELGGHQRIYRSLLRVFPADYRISFGDQMVQLFGDQLRDAGPTRTWLTAMGDIPRSAVSEHLRRNRTVAHSMAIAPSPASRVLGVLGIIGGAFLLVGFIPVMLSDVSLGGEAFGLLRLVLFNLGAIAISIGVYRRNAAAGRLRALSASLPVVLANAAYCVFIIKLVAQPGELGPGDYQPIGLFTLTTAAMWLSDAWLGVVTLWIGAMSRLSSLALLVGSISALVGMNNFDFAPEGSLALNVILVGVGLLGVGWILLGLEIALKRRPAAPKATT